MRQTELLQEIRKMRFEDIYEIWTEKRLTQEDAARMLGICSRTFRRYIDRYEEYGLEGLKDKRLEQLSSRRAPVEKEHRGQVCKRVFACDPKPLQAYSRKGR